MGICTLIEKMVRCFKRIEKRGERVSERMPGYINGWWVAYE